MLYAGQCSAVKMLTDQNGDVKIADCGGFTPMMCAAMRGHSSVVEIIHRIEYKNITLRDKGGRTALMWAAEQGHTKSVKKLIKYGANVNETEPIFWVNAPNLCRIQGCIKHSKVIHRKNRRYKQRRL